MSLIAILSKNHHRVLLSSIICFLSINRGMAHGFYKLSPLKLGAEVGGIDLGDNKTCSSEVIEQIKKDVTEHRLLVFRGQGVINGDRHVEISKWFGELESTFYKHPKSPHPDVFRVSNDVEEGCTGVGRTGWHIDGSFQRAPFSYSLYHMVSIPKHGDTVFAPLTDIIDGLSSEKKDRWERLWMASDRRAKVIHPLIYSHPVTGKQVLCFHLGMTESFVWDYGTETERWTEEVETVQILQEIHHEFVKNDKIIQYSHKWQTGDFIISDNLAIGHEASPETQFPRQKVGLRILHRTTVKGTKTPQKVYQERHAEL